MVQTTTAKVCGHGRNRCMNPSRLLVISHLNNSCSPWQEKKASIPCQNTHIPLDEALRNETRRGMQVIRSGETRTGASRFAEGHETH